MGRDTADGGRLSRRGFVVGGGAAALALAGAGLTAPAANAAGAPGRPGGGSGSGPGFGSGFPVGPWTRYGGNPVLTADPRHSWESKYVFNPAAIVAGGLVYLLYRAQGEDLVSRIGLAWSHDGVHFERAADPVIEPDSDVDSHGCEDPRVVRIGATYYLTYTAYDGSSARLSLATSTDLRNWTKHGAMFGDFVTPGNSKPWSKSGAILTTPIGGKYYLYFGDLGIFPAVSTDLKTWTPSSTPVVPMEPNDFTRKLVEAGPPPVLNADGRIVLLHNAAEPYGSALRYSPGQVVIDPAEPTTCLARMTRPWLTPTTPYETTGQVPNTIFVEGLVELGGTWHAYYGASDTVVALATYRPR
jgi:beta-1,2-mannosidase